jgi:hypothetical protein
VKKIAKISAALLVATAGIASAAQAGPGWRVHHPYRAHDNDRLAYQNHRITQGVRDGQISHAEAHKLRADDHAIRAEERADASVNGTHLTRQDQRQIRAQENANSRDIYNARHGN